MLLTHSIEQARGEVLKAKRDGKTVGFVPTMGALHRGHTTLIKHAREQCDFCAISVFVNPAQFGPNEDLAKYPRTLDSDTQKCEAAGVDLLFVPSAADMYPRGYGTWVDVNGPTEILEGERRPGHFRGVTTVCTKLFNIISPDYAYFGKKDYQQLAVISKMVADLNLPLTVVPVETVREADGLAMSSRNVYLNSCEREAALVLHKSLDTVRRAFRSGERRASVIRSTAEHVIEAEPMASIDYVAVVDASTLSQIETVERPAVVLLAVKVGTTRLIDNIVLE